MCKWGSYYFTFLLLILGKVNTRKACGPDNITNKIIHHLIPTLHIILQELLNICVFHGYHHRTWKRAWAHKLSKRRSDPCSYRPISLLCCLSKVFKAIIITKRLMSLAENTGKLPREQSGFSKQMTSSLSLPKPFVRLNNCLGARAPYF